MELKLRIEFDAPVHHGTGMGIAGLVDRAFLRDSRGIPYLAGSAIKGKLRYGALLCAEGEGVCSGRDFCGKPGGCEICRLFGSPRRAGRAVFENGFPEGSVLELVKEQVADSAAMILSGPTEVRHSTAMNRVTRTVERQLLFSTETVLPSLRFESRIFGKLGATELQLLKNSAKMLTHFGSGSARGLGFCRYELEAEI